MSNVVTLGANFDEYPTLLKASQDNSRIRIVIGCAGSGKTSIFGAVEILKLACMQEASPVDNVRYTNFLVGRLTYQQLESSTIATFKRMLEPLFTFKTGSIPPKATADFQLPDGTRVKCLIEFLSFDSEDAQNKLLGYEPTAAFLDEISEMPESLLLAVNRRLGRAYTNGAPRTFTGLMAATNGPRKNHWLYEWDSGKRDAQFELVSRETGRSFVKIFKQPPGLLKKPDGSWVPNPAAENIKNLEGGYAYYFSMLSDPWPKIQAYVLGEFADLVTGKLVFTEFNRDLHVVPAEKFTFRYGQGLLLSFDFGRTPVCIIAVASTSGRVTVIDEVVGEDMSIDTLCTDHLLPLLKAKYANSPIDGAWGDPAGMTENQATDLSPFDVLMKHGIPVMDPGSNKIAPRLEAVKQMLTKLDTQGKPKLQILDSCKLLINAIGSDYIYEMTRGAVVKDVPTKTHVNWASDLCDGLQYMALGYTSSGLGRERRHLPKLTRKFI